MTFLDRYVLIALLTYVGVSVGNDDDNELVKVCRPIALRLNVMFLLDGSGSVSGSTFAMQMKMLDKISNLMHIGTNESQIAVLQYAGFTRLEFGFDNHQALKKAVTPKRKPNKRSISILARQLYDYLNHDDLLKSLRSIRHMSGTTKTGKAMMKALELFQKAKREDNDVSQVAVVVTDGHSHDNPLPAAEALRAAGITILTLGIGDHINREEIVRISGKDELAFQNLHKDVPLEHFVAGFKNLSQGEHCEYARGIEGAEITCGPDFIQVEVSTTKKLQGRLFFEGFLLEPGCSSPEDGSREVPGRSRFDVHVKAAHGKCGLVKTYEAKKRGFVMSSRAVLQFDRRFSSARDHSFEIRCSYPDKTKVAKNPRRAEGATTLVQDAVQFGDEALAGLGMKCSYNVTPLLQHCSSNSITVGATLLHSWKCDKEHHRFRVHSCFVIDPVTRRTEMVVDSNGCSVEDSIIGTVSYSADGAVSATGRATRFADVPVVRFSCRLRPCKGSSEQCAAEVGELPHCRSKRDLPAVDSATFQPLSEVGEYEIAAYDDNVEGVMSAPERATRVMMEGAATQASQTSTSALPSTGPLVSLKSISSVTPPSFPLGGVDVKLNTKTVAIVASNLARDRLKEALQLRANSLSVDVSPAAARRLADGREQILHVSEGIRPEQSVLRVLTGNGLTVKQVQGFVRQLERPTTGQEEQHLVRSPTTGRPPTLPTAAPSEGFELSTRKGIVRKEIRKRRSRSPTSTTNTPPFSSTFIGSTQKVAAVEINLMDDFEEEVVVVSDTLIVRLPHETFVTGCSQTAQC